MTAWHVFFQIDGRVLGVQVPQRNRWHVFCYMGPMLVYYIQGSVPSCAIRGARRETKKTKQETRRAADAQAANRT